MKLRMTSAWASSLLLLLLMPMSALAQLEKTDFDKARYASLANIDLFVSMSARVDLAGLRASQSGAGTAAAVAGGVDGALVASNVLQVNKECTAKVAEQLPSPDRRLEQELAQSLTAALGAAGYRVNYLAQQVLPRDATTRKIDFAKLASGAEAAMYANIALLSYSQEGDKIVPSVGIDVFLYVPKEEKLVYRRMITVGKPTVPHADILVIESNQAQSFASRDELCADPKRASDRLRLMATSIAATVAAGLSK